MINTSSHHEINPLLEPATNNLVVFVAQSCDHYKKLIKENLNLIVGNIIFVEHKTQILEVYVKCLNISDSWEIEHNFGISEDNLGPGNSRRILYWGGY